MTKREALALLLDVVNNMDSDQIVLVGGFDIGKVIIASNVIADHLDKCDEQLRVS